MVVQACVDIPGDNICHKCFNNVRDLQERLDWTFFSEACQSILRRNMHKGDPVITETAKSVVEMENLRTDWMKLSLL
jgi:hypothetical protein